MGDALSVHESLASRSQKPASTKSDFCTTAITNGSHYGDEAAGGVQQEGMGKGVTRGRPLYLQAKFTLHESPHP